MEGARSTTLVPLLVAGVLSIPLSAHAGNEDEFQVGNSAAMAGGAVLADVQDGSATFYNPAGLAHVERASVDVSASAYSLRKYDTPAALQSTGGQRQGVSIVEFVSVPTQVSYVRRLRDGLSMGLGAFVPQAGGMVLRTRLVESGPDGSSTWSVDERDARTSYALGAALGHRVSSRLRLGGGVFALYDEESTSSSFFGSIERGGVTRRAAQWSTLIDSARLAGELRAGLQWDVTEHLTVALAGRGPRLQVLRSGSGDFAEVDSSTGAGGAPEIVAYSVPFDETNSQRGLLTWGRYHVGGAYRRGRVTLSAEGDLQPGLNSQRTGTVRKLTWNARAGVRYRLDGGSTLGGGLFTDRATAPRKAGGYWADYYGATLGLAHDHNLSLSGEPQADSMIMSTVFAVRYAFGWGRGATLQVDDGAVDGGALVESSTARFTVHELGLHVGSALHF